MRFVAKDTRGVEYPFTVTMPGQSMGSLDFEHPDGYQVVLRDHIAKGRYRIAFVDFTGSKEIEVTCDHPNAP